MRRSGDPETSRFARAFRRSPRVSPVISKLRSYYCQILAGAEGFEPPSPVLETGSLAVELTPLRLLSDLAIENFQSHNDDTITQLLRFLMRRVLAATPAKSAELQTTSGLLFVLGCRIIALFAIRAL
jgi:hypothetical protein